MEPSFEPQTSKFPHKPHLCRPRGGCPWRCDTVHDMLCFVRAEHSIRSGELYQFVPCHNNSQATPGRVFFNKSCRCPSTSPSPRPWSCYSGTCGLVPVEAVERDGPMVEVSKVAFRNKRHRRPLFHVLFRQTIGQKGTVQTKDQVWSARRQLKAVATMSLISRVGALISRHGFPWSMVNHLYAMWKISFTSVPNPRNSCLLELTTSSFGRLPAGSPWVHG